MFSMSVLSWEDASEVRRLRKLVFEPDEKPDVVRRQILENRVEILGPGHRDELVLLGAIGFGQLAGVEPAIEAKI